MSVVCDSSSLISLSNTCLIHVIYKLKPAMNGNFVIPPAVEQEIIARPMHIKRFEFSSFRLKKCLEDNVFEVRNPKGLSKETGEIMRLANNCFSIGGSPLKVIQDGEAQCLALICLDESRPLFLVDEKTTRMFIEAPNEIKKMVESKRGKGVSVNTSNLEKLKKKLAGIQVIRSTELLAMAHKNGYFDGFGKEANEAFSSAVYALRYNGCSLTLSEIQEYERMTKEKI